MSSVFRDRTYSYLLVRSGEKYNHYLRLHEGLIEVVRFHKEAELVQNLVPYNKYSLRHAAEVYSVSHLPKTDQALQVLDVILKSTDDDQMNFLLDIPPEKADRKPRKSKLEKSTKEERQKEKANTVTLEKLAVQLSTTPSRIRAAFRRHNTPKPGARWEWKKSEQDQILKMIKAIL